MILSVAFASSTDFCSQNSNDRHLADAHFAAACLSQSGVTAPAVARGFVLCLAAEATAGIDARGGA